MTRTQLLIRTLLTGLISGGLTACGGSSTADNDGVSVAGRLALSGVEPVSTLVADDGSIMPSDPDAVPKDGAAWTRAGRYATARQAEQLERALGDGVLRVDVECCGIGHADQAIGIAYGLQAAGNLPNSAPVLVRAADLRLGAAVANRMSDAGYGNVWLVTR